jgi:two-component system CheB/CheR fusion protein
MNVTEPHHIVALGASAGGLEELIAFFENTPLDGVAYVVVQHLPADYESRMAEVLSRHSKLVMLHVEDGMSLRINHVYLIPSHVFMTIKGGHLYLTGKNNQQGPHMTINTFFVSLAAECAHKAIGVILSGMGSDGSDGVKALKRAGGMVIARNPETAEYNSMPSNAIATGMVDFIVEPELMPGVIEDYVKREIDLLAASISDDHNMAGLIELIGQQLPLDFSDYKQTTLLRRIKRRAAYNNFELLENYLEFARSNPIEIEELAKDFLISVTAFFRDPDAFEVLEKKVLAQILASLVPGQEIRIWVTGCATGEEAYSVAILIAELLGSRITQHEVKIFATDIDTAALAHAAKGIYTAAVLSQVPKAYLNTYFTCEDQQYKIIPEIRKMVIFARHDLVKNPPYCNMHLISCRNLLIYMTPSLQKKIFQMLLFGLKADGYLFLGSSENPAPILQSLEIIDKKWKIYRNSESKREVSFDVYSLPEAIYHNPPKPAFLQEAAKSPDRTLDAALNETVFNQMQRLVVCIDENNRVLKSYGPTSRFLHQKNFASDLTELLPAPLAIAFKTLQIRVSQTLQTCAVTGIAIRQDQETIRVNLSVTPMVYKGRRNGLLVVSFSQQEHTSQHASDTMAFDETLYLNEYTLSLEQENRELKEDLAASNEKLMASNENMQSFNEELLSSNEEMQSTNEEMQSINEELHTINADYQLKNKALVELNDDLNNYFKSNINGQLFIDQDLRLIRFSPGTVRLINLMESDIGRPITHISTNFKFETLTGDISQVFTSGLPITREVQATAGQWYQVMTMPYVQQLTGKKTGAIITFNDITQLKSIQHQLDKKNEILVRINEDLDNFVHTASHDLLAPLGRIEGSITVMNQMEVADPELKQFMLIIDDSIRKFRSLINDIAAVAKIEDQALITEVVDLHEILDNIEWSLEDKIQQTGALITRDFQVSQIHFSKKNLRSILFNLVSNAIKYRSEHSPLIGVQTIRNSAGIVLSVNDNGQGMDQRGIDKIFDKYARITTDREGQGIGLYLAKKMIDAAGGHIEVESVIGSGSKFRLYFPSEISQ